MWKLEVIWKFLASNLHVLIFCTTSYPSIYPLLCKLHKIKPKVNLKLIVTFGLTNQYLLECIFWKNHYHFK